MLSLPYSIWRAGRQHNHCTQAAAGKDIEGGQLFLGVGVPHEEVTAEGVQATLARGQVADVTQERAAAPPAAQGQFPGTRQGHRESLAVVGAPLARE